MCNLRVLVLVSSFSLFVFESAFGVKEIRDDGTGGDCQAIGNWDRGTKICTLTGNLNEGIEILDNEITLVGNQHTLTGNGAGSGVKVIDKKNVSILNLGITNFHIGVDVRGGKDHEIENCTITGINAAGFLVGLGIVLMNHHGSFVVHNKITNNDGMGIYLAQTDLTTIAANKFENNIDAIFLDRSSKNNITENDLQGSSHNGADGMELRDRSNNNTITYNKLSSYERGRGLRIEKSDRNLVMFNEFQGNQTSAIRVEADGNRMICNDMIRHGPMALLLANPAIRNSVLLNNFYNVDDANELNAPNVNSFRHNYWQRNPNCPDANMDGICDVPYVFANSTDERPHKEPIPWKVSPALCFGASAGRPVDTWYPPFEDLGSRENFERLPQRNEEKVIRN